jgi:flagellar hook-associated protein 1
MGSTFGGLEIGKRSLFAQQSALNTVSHNIANANTEGYTRQRAVMRATEAYPNPSMNNPVIPGQVGTGVMVTEIVRLRDQFLDQQYYRENNNYGTWDMKQSSMDKVQNILNEPSDSGLQNAMDQFWQSWQDLAKDPTNSSAQQLVVERGNALTETFHQVSQSFTDLRNDIGKMADTASSPTMIGDKMGEINNYANQISDLNGKISNELANGYTPNDLFDQRNLILDKLSKVVNINVTQVSDANGKDTGMIKVSIGGANGTTGSDIDIVNGKTANSFSSANLSSVTGGELKTLIDFVNGSGDATDKYGGQSVIDYYAGQIDQLATNLSTQFNANSGRPLFNAGDAATISIAPNSFSNLASSFTIDPSVARGIADPLNQSYRTLISKLGTDAQEAQSFASNAEAAVTAVDNSRQSVSGVSLDEEMTDMIKYQHAYSAASRTITTMDEMLDKLINGTGKVGL